MGHEELHTQNTAVHTRPMHNAHTRGSFAISIHSYLLFFFNTSLLFFVQGTFRLLLLMVCCFCASFLIFWFWCCCCHCFVFQFTLKFDNQNDEASITSHMYTRTDLSNNTTFFFLFFYFYVSSFRHWNASMAVNRILSWSKESEREIDGRMKLIDLAAMIICILVRMHWNKQFSTIAAYCS